VTCNGHPEIKVDRLGAGPEMDMRWSAQSCVVQLPNARRVSSVCLALKLLKKPNRAPRPDAALAPNRELPSRARVFAYCGKQCDLNKLKSSRRSGDDWIEIHQFNPSMQVPNEEVWFDLTIPIIATHLMIEYTEFDASVMDIFSKLTCPRCNSAVDNKHGVCRQCGEVAFQCRSCRNINYDHLDAFLCVECGHCRFAEFTYKIKSRRASWVCKDDKPDDLLRCLDQSLRDVESDRKILRSLKSDFKAYETVCRDTSFSCMEKMNDVTAYKKRLATFGGVEVADEFCCYGCIEAFMSVCLNIFLDDTIKKDDKKLANILFQCASTLRLEEHTNLARSCLVNMCKLGSVTAFERVCGDVSFSCSSSSSSTLMMRVELLGEILKFERRDMCLNALWRFTKNRGEHTLCCVQILAQLLNDASSNSVSDRAIRKALLQHTGNTLKEMIKNPESRELRVSVCEVFEILIRTEGVQIFQSLCSLLQFDADSEDSCQRFVELANMLASQLGFNERLASPTFLKHIIESMTRCVETNNFSSSHSSLLYALCQSLKAMVPVLQNVWSCTYLCETYAVLMRLRVAKRCPEIILAQDLIEELVSRQDPRTKLRAAAMLLKSDKASQRLRLCCLRDVCEIVEPTPKARSFTIELIRAETQEDFFRGTVQNNPMQVEDLSSSSKATFKDLLIKIAVDLELQDATSLLELLVCGNIVSCDLEIEQVFEKLWLPYLKEFSEDEFGEDCDQDNLDSLPMRVMYVLCVCVCVCVSFFASFTSRTHFTRHTIPTTQV